MATSEVSQRVVKNLFVHTYVRVGAAIVDLFVV